MHSENIKSFFTFLLERNAYFVGVHRLLVAYCFVAAVSIALSQILLGVALLYSLVFFMRSTQADRMHVFRTPITAAWTYWILAGFISAICGIDLGHALKEWASSFAFLLLPFVILQSFDWSSANSSERLTKRIRDYLLALVAGQTIAALHSIASVALNTDLWPKLPGAVTESGQLALLIPCVIALYRTTLAEQDLILETTLTGVLSAILLLLAWPPIASVGISIALTISVVLICGALWTRSVRGINDHQYLFRKVFIMLCGCLMTTAFIVNLKRGPWAGVFVALIILGAVTSRRLLIKTVLFSAVILLALFPARHRLLSGLDDFAISGGRKIMWSLGANIVQRFPLGVGLDNANYMRRMNENLPPLHRHMHNNLLNVAVETGWIGLAAYCWWIAACIGVGFSVIRRISAKNPLNSYALCFSCALIAWQIAGLVEYNLGDAEVRLIALFLIGLLLCIQRAALADPPCAPAPP